MFFVFIVIESNKERAENHLSEETVQGRENNQVMDKRAIGKIPSARFY